MNTKEAIRSVEEQKLRQNAINKDVFGIEGIAGYNKKSDDFIELLKRGEKFEKMCEEM